MRTSLIDNFEDVPGISVSGACLQLSPCDAYAAANSGVQVTARSPAASARMRSEWSWAGRLAAGNPPDVWQTCGRRPRPRLHQDDPRRRLRPCYRRDQGGSWPTILDCDGRRQAVCERPPAPTSPNVLFFNKAVLQTPLEFLVPAAAYTTSRSSPPIWRSSRPKARHRCAWAAKTLHHRRTLLENILLGTAGPKAWGDPRQI